MSSFAQTLNGDLDISTGNLVVVSSTQVAQLTAWKLSNLFAFFLGEWFMDVSLGIPYVQTVFVNNPNLPYIEDMYRRVINSAPGVASIANINLDYNRRARSLAATFEAITNDGALLRGGLGTPFIVNQTRPGGQ